MTELIESLNVVSGPTPWTEISDPAVQAIIPLVSVNMVTYNHAPYIAQAIEGVLQQKTNFPIELVIGEDCSTDGTHEIVLNFQQKYPSLIRVITSEKNVGARVNGNRVRRSCRGKYIAFCDGDDYWHYKNKLNIQIDSLESNQDVGLIHCDVDRFYVEKNVRIKSYHKKRRLSYKYNNILYGIIVYEYIVETCTAVVRNDLLKKIHEECQYEFSDIFMMGDVQMWIEIAYRSKVKYIDESYATRNILPESLSISKDFNKNISFWKSCNNIHMHYANKYGGDESDILKNTISYNYYNLLCRLSYKARDPKLGMEIIEESRKNGVSLSLISYLCVISTQNNLASQIIRFGIYLTLQCRRLLAQIKWLWA
jgi:glycosyltransferase involved in cell wall biosynthesis